MIGRRTFTWASLGLLASRAARAEVIEDEVAPGEVLIDVAREAHEVRVTVSFRGRIAMNVLTARGDTSGAMVGVEALVDGEAIPLARTMRAPERRQLMSRMGPMPVWTAVPAGAEASLGVSSFVPLRDGGACALRVHVRVDTEAGELVRLVEVGATQGRCEATRVPAEAM